MNTEPKEYFVSKGPDLTLTGSLLVVQFNEMVATATDLGLVAKEVNRFKDNASGVKRTEALHIAIQAEITRKAATETEDLKIAEGIGANTEGRPAETPEEVHPLDQGNQSHRAPEGTNRKSIDPEASAPGQPESEEATERLPDETEEAHMARKAKAKKSATKKKSTGGGKKVKSTDGSTIREMTDEYNQIVKGMSAALKKEVTFAKHHTSNFETKDKAKAQLKKLRDAIKKAG